MPVTWYKEGMTESQFEKLEVFRLAESLCDIVWDMVTAWPIFAKDTVGKQLVRAADSIGANIAEGAGRKSYQDNRRFVRIARASLNETRYWLRRALIRDLITPGQVEQLKPLVDILVPRINAYLNSIGRKPKSERLPDAPIQATGNGPRTTDDGPRATDRSNP